MAASLDRVPRRLEALFRLSGSIACALATTAAVTVLIGWWTGTEPLIHMLAGTQTMAPNTALMSVLAGLSLGLAMRAESARIRRLTAQALALVVLLIAIPTIAGHALGFDIGIESVVVRGTLERWPAGAPRTLAAIALSLISTALLLAGRTTRRGVVAAELAALGAAVLALCALLGILFGVPGEVGGPAVLLSSGGMSIPSALVVLALVHGVFVLDADRGIARIVLARDAGGLVARQMLVGLAILPPIAVAAVIGARIGLYGLPIASALVVLFALAEASGLILMTARRLSRIDAATHEATAALQASEQRERQLRAELEALWVATSVVSEALTEKPSSELDRVLQRIAEQARTLTDARYAAVAIGTNPERPFDQWATAGMDARVADAIGRKPCPIGVLGHAIRHGRPLRVHDVRAHASFAGLPPHHPEIDSFMAVPIMDRQRPVGHLYLGNKQGASEFTEHDERIIGMLAARVGIAIEIATLYANESSRRAWLQSIIDQLPEGVILLDAKGIVQAMNKAVIALGAGVATGHDPYGNPAVFDVRGLDGRPVEFEKLPVVRALRSGEPIDEEELLVRHPSGHLIPIAARAAPVRDDANSLTGAVVVVRDISAQKELERVREEWTAVIAHDLRQPVNSILLHMDLLAGRRHRPDEADKILPKVRRSAWHLNRMIEDLLDVARLASNQLTIDQRVVDVVELAQTTLETLRLGHPDAVIELDAPPRQLAWIDADRIQQVLTNLVSNAVKYGDLDKPIRVEIQRDDGSVRVGVVNHGPPIPPGELARLFTRFSRTRHARETGKPGIGLGLYICRGLIDAHGGRIGVESDTTSTRFFFTVPEPMDGVTESEDLSESPHTDRPTPLA
ncbi:MAG TPA: ATP-binding protein [Kofleriaceae bacterium]|nr:ATP-binding protein [Kofleriaceae bacterium]